MKHPKQLVKDMIGHNNIKSFCPKCGSKYPEWATPKDNIEHEKNCRGKL